MITKKTIKASLRKYLIEQKVLCENVEKIKNINSKVTLFKKFADIYNIIYNGEVIGTIDIPSGLDGDTISIGDVNIKPEFRGKGLGVETYKAAMNIADKPLESFMATDEANRVWNSLIKQGLAKKTDKGFITINDSTK